MEFELLVQTDSGLSMDELEQLREEAQELSPDNPEEYIRKRRHIKYKLMTVDVTRISPFQRHDDEHTMIYLGDGDYAFLAKIKYEQFREIKEKLTGRHIYTIDEFKFAE